jgi:hypothetical protein
MKQRYRLYEAEDASGIGELWTTPDGMQAWLDWVARTKFWRENSSVRHFKVRYPVPGQMSGARKFTGEGERRVAEISFGPFSLCMLTALHEITHLTKNLYSEGFDDEQDHGRAFATMELRIVKRYLSAESAAKLADKFTEYGVEFDPAWRE